MKKTTTLLATVVAFFCFSTSKAQAPVAGLKAYYSFNGSANDQSGNGYTGTVTGATATTDKDGNANSAYAFDGNSDYILFNNSFDYEFRTVSFWFNASSITSSLSVVYSSDNKNLVYGMTAVSLRKINNVNKLIFNVADILDTADITINEWHHVVITVNDDSTSMYLDCDLVGTKAFTSYYHSLDVATNDLVGASRALTNAFFAGKVDEVRIYDEELTGDALDSLCSWNNQTSVAQLLAGDRISMYPNPATNFLELDLSSLAANEHYGLKIVNALSQLVYEGNNNGANIVRIDLSGIQSKGIYFLHVTNASGDTVAVRKVVLQ